MEFELTIVAFGRSVNSSLQYMIAADCFDVHYRVFCERERDYKEYLHGLGTQKILERGRTVQGSMGVPMITVYTRKNEKVQIDQGATVLDFAFYIHPKLAFGAKYAYLNRQRDKIPLYVRLNHGDTVEIVSSTAKDRGEDEPYVEHAELRWEEWVITKKARKALTRYLEERVGREVPLIMVMDAQSGQNYSLVYNATPFDLAVAVDPVRALCFKEAYLNKSKVPCSFDRALQYQDKVRIVYREEPGPDFQWLRSVRTDEARNVLIDYFAPKIAAAGVK
jgi:(p)ppGpp synthase/HD superfamily hydrolase